MKRLTTSIYWSNVEILLLLLEIDKGYQPTTEEKTILRERTELSFFDFYIPVLPESIGILANLQKLNLRSNRITSLPESIGHLSNIEWLNLTRTQITTLPESFGQLTNLQELNLNITQITALPESFGQLANLQRLDLSNTQITTLPESFGQLVNLQILDLNNTQITALPESFGQLTNLHILDLSNSQITTLPESFGQLANLQSLDLGATPITTLPESFDQLSNLQTLDLANTAITALPRWIGDLSSLQHLNLQNLTLSYIPKSLALRELPFVETERFDNNECGVNLFGVTLKKQKKAVFLETPNLIPSLYKEEDLIPIRECRVIFLGDGASGKSYTIKRFRNGGKKETKSEPYITAETPGVEILDYHVERDADSFDVHFWDFGGQQLLHSMHRCFLSEDSCYVVTVKTRETKANERARYWLRNVTAFAPKSPILLFVNCWEYDNGQRSIDEPGLRAEFPMIREVVYCSAKQATGREFREKLMQPTLEMAAASPGCTKQVPRQWIAVRNVIEIESRERNYLTKTRYHELCDENDIENEQAPELLSFFNSLGVCFSYHRDEYKKELDEYKLLNPVWLTNALYAIIEEGMAQSIEGRIKDSAIRQMLCNPAPLVIEGKEQPHRRTAPNIHYKKEECPWLLAVAESYDLCYRVNEKTLFFPALCGTGTPECALTAPLGFPRHVSYLLRYAYLPDSVLHQLMVRCMRNRLSVECCWLQGMVLYIGNLHRIFIRMAEDESLRIDIYSSEPQLIYELFWMLRQEIGKVNRKLNLQAQEFILDKKDQFQLDAVVDAAKDNAFVYGIEGKRNARELLGRFYEETAAQSIRSMRVDGKNIVIPIISKEFHPCPKDKKALQRALYEAYDKICPYCGNVITSLLEMQIDHIFPTKYRDNPVLKSYVDYLSANGFDIYKPDYIENFFPSHASCNRRKSNRVNEYSLPYWHDIAAQHAPKVIRLMEKYKDSNISNNE